MDLSLRTIRRFLSRIPSCSSILSQHISAGTSRIPPCSSILSQNISAGTSRSSLSPVLSNQIRHCSGSVSSNICQMGVTVRIGEALHRLTIQPTDTVGSLKLMMAHQSLIPKDADHLIYIGQSLLEDEYVLVKCGIKEGDLLSICKVESFVVEVQLLGPQSIILRVDASETVGSLKAKIKEELAHSGVNSKRQSLYYRRRLLQDDERRLIGYTIMKPSRRRVVITLGDDSFSDEDEKPDMYGVQQDQESVPDVIQPQTVMPSIARYLTEMHIIVFVEFPRLGKRIPVNVTPMDTIDDVMAMSRYSFNGMNLLFGKKKKQLLKVDGSIKARTLKECGIQNHDSIIVVKDTLISILIKIPGQGKIENMEIFTKYVECFDTIGMVKSKIYDKTGICPEFQRLKYYGWWLDDDTSTLVDHGIFDPQVAYTILLFPLLSSPGELN